MAGHMSPISREETDTMSEHNFEEPPPAPVSVVQTINNNTLTRSKSKGGLKVLKRSMALTESTSPPPDIALLSMNPPIELSPHDLPSPTSPNNGSFCFPNLVQNGSLASNTSPSIKRERSTGSNWSSLSRGNSTELLSVDPSGCDVVKFLKEILTNSPKDRHIILTIEAEILNIINNSRVITHKFGIMSSYQRMLVHRIAHYFKLEHNTDATGQFVIVTKTKNTQQPENSLSDLIRDYALMSEEPRRSILKRDSASFEDTSNFRSSDRHMVDAPRRSKSFEEREEEYEKARRRIFQQEQGENSLRGDERWRRNLMWTDSNTNTNKLHPNINTKRDLKLTKNESFENAHHLKANSLRDTVTKANSFDSSASRVLMKQDSGSSQSSRVSPAGSSGYKSQRSDTTFSATPSPSATPHLQTQLSSQSGVVSPEPDHEPTVMWAVTNINSVPTGSVLINPESGRPLTNPDGSLYHFDPTNPPKIEPSKTHPNHGAVPTEPDHDATTAQMPLATLPSASEVSSSGQAMQNRNRSTQLTLYPPPTQPASTAYSQSHRMVAGSAPSPYSYSQQYQPAPDSYATASHPIYTNMQATPQHTGYSALQNVQQYNMDSTQELCGYLMSLSLGEIGRVDNTHRPVFFCPTTPALHSNTPPVHFPQAQGMPLVLQGPSPPTMQPRGNMFTAQPPMSYSVMERPTAAECAYSQPPVHSYFARCPPNSQMAPGSAGPSYCTNQGNTTGMGITPLPIPQAPSTPPRLYQRMPPTNPQTSVGVPQYPMYNSTACYPPYQTANPPPFAPMLRPAWQMNSPPHRGAGYGSTARSPVTDPSQQHMSRFAQPAVPPVFRFTYPSANELILLNASRSPFNQQGNNRCNSALANPRRSMRPRPPVVNSRPLLSVGAASQQQAALATAIEAAGLAIPGGGRFE